LAATEVLFFQDIKGNVPLVQWLDALPPKAAAKCVARLKRLEDLGQQLRRPEADYLRDGIYELRAALQGVNYRMLYFFHGKRVVLVSHGFTKQQTKVPPGEIEMAIANRAEFQRAPKRHTFKPGN
jgi:phage-related protein